MKKILFLIATTLTLTACADFKWVLVDGTYDVPIEVGEIRGETTYFVNAIYQGTKNKPAPSIQQDVYVKAIEELSGCSVIPSSIRWKENDFLLEPTIMSANVDC